MFTAGRYPRASALSDVIPAAGRADRFGVVRRYHAVSMGDADRRRKPLLRGRGWVPIEEFCRITGLDQATVDQLMRTARLKGALVSTEGSPRVVGIFDDELPSRDALVAMGLPVSADYDPDALRLTDGDARDG